MKRAAFALAFAALAAGTSPAVADSQAEAVVLFDQGIKDMRAGRLDQACTELQASLDLVKDSGTKGALARCHGLAGRVASAWLLWRELADTAPTAELRADAAAQAARLEPRLPTYTIKLAGPTPGLVVELNGRGVASNMAVPVPIDPGKISVRASGRDGDRATTETWTHTYTAVEGQILAIEVPVLASRAAKGGPVEPGLVSTERADRRHTRHLIALVLGGVALGAGGAGAYFGLDARSKFAAARRVCGGVIDQCQPDQLAASQTHVDASRTSATRSTLASGVAGAALATAVIVWISAPSLEAKGVVVAPTAGSGSVGLVLGGAF